MTGQPDPELGAAIAKAMGSAEAPLTRYIRANLAMLKAERARGITWKVIAQALQDRGILDINGQPPNGNTVRVAYDRVVRSTKPKPAPVGRPRLTDRAQAPHPTKVFE